MSVDHRNALACTRDGLELLSVVETANYVEALGTAEDFCHYYLLR
jgi:hypothetical protein